ncbi:MAG: adenylate/guanylate cyclase domain-containing protein [Ignavibacteriaceae bacterium]
MTEVSKKYEALSVGKGDAMVLKRRTQIKIKQLGILTGTWMLVGIFITIYDYLALTTQYSLGPSTEYSFDFALAMNLVSALIGALLGGSFMVFYINVKFQDKPYGYTIAAVAVSFILIIGFIILILGLIFVPLKTGKSLFDPVTRASLNNFLFDTSRIKNTMIWSVVVGLTQLFLQMNNKFGHGVFWNILKGKYNTPKEEYRIFMSLDINSSTAIAEKLGNEKYHELLKDFFADVTNPIIDNRGEIYQYVGDEVVVAWKYEDGIEDNQCINCFFDMKKQIEKKKDKYLKYYGLVPSFKAGIHWGKVIVGEVGIIKRDITYSGDVLNTTSRILNKCKEFDVEIIASEDILSALNLTRNYVARSLGSFKLRGKGKEILLTTLKLAP